MSRTPGRLPRAVGAAILLLLASGCGEGSADAGDGDATSRAGGGTETTVTVLAAASLTEVFPRIAADVETDHPGLTVELSFAASSTIVQQVNAGAPADVVALAGESPLTALDPAALADEPSIFATNSLVIAVPRGNPGGIESLADLGRAGVDSVVCEEQVPCGQAARTLLEAAGVTPHIVSYEPDVRATLTKVTLGEADAGLVYRTDVAPAGGQRAAVDSIDIPPAANVVNRYPIATVSTAPAATAFVTEVLSARGQAHLAAAGFGPP